MLPRRRTDAAPQPDPSKAPSAGPAVHTPLLRVPQSKDTGRRGREVATGQGSSFLGRREAEWQLSDRTLKVAYWPAAPVPGFRRELTWAGQAHASNVSFPARSRNHSPGQEPTSATPPQSGHCRALVRSAEIGGGKAQRRKLNCQATTPVFSPKFARFIGRPSSGTPIAVDASCA